MFSPEVCSHERGDAAVSESMNVPSAPFANRNTMAAVSSTGKPRVALDVVAWTATMSPTQRHQVVHLMGQVEQDRSAAGLAPPAVADLEVVVGL